MGRCRLSPSIFFIQTPLYTNISCIRKVENRNHRLIPPFQFVYIRLNYKQVILAVWSCKEQAERLSQDCCILIALAQKWVVVTIMLFTASKKMLMSSGKLQCSKKSTLKGLWETSMIYPWVDILGGGSAGILPAATLHGLVG